MREKKSIAPKTTVEMWKIGRRLVRSRLVKSEEPQGDSKMTEMDGPSTAGKPGPPSDTETHVSHSVAAEPHARKRIAASSASELHDESLQQPPPGLDATHGLRRSKPTEPSQKDTQGHSGLESVETPAAALEDLLDISIDFPEGAAEDTTDSRKDDIASSHGQAEEPKESRLSDERCMQYDDTIITENVAKVIEGAVVEEVSKLHLPPEHSQPTEDIEEVVSEFSPGADGCGDIFEAETNNDAEELQPETDVLAEDVALRTDEEHSGAVTEDVNEMTPEYLNTETIEQGELTEDAAEASDKSNDGNNQIAGEADQSSETAAVTEVSNIDTTVSKEGSSTMASPAATSLSSTMINLHARAKERAAQRLASISPATRGRGRVVACGRGRGGRVSGRRPVSRPASGGQS